MSININFLRSSTKNLASFVSQWAAMQQLFITILYLTWRNSLSVVYRENNIETRSEEGAIWSRTHWNKRNSYFSIIYTLMRDKYIWYMKIRFRFQSLAYTIIVEQLTYQKIVFPFFFTHSYFSLPTATKKSFQYGNK